MCQVGRSNWPEAETPKKVAAEQKNIPKSKLQLIGAAEIKCQKETK